MTPLDILNRDKEAAHRFAQQVGHKRSVVLLERAQRDLNQRLAQREELRGPADQSFTTTQMRVVKAQIVATLAELQQGMKTTVVDVGASAAQSAAANLVAYTKRAEQHFTGITQRMAFSTATVLDRAVQGAESSVLHRLVKGEGPQKKGILQRYGEATVQRFEEQLQTRFLAKKPWAEVRDSLVSESPFLQQAPGFWAERIVRTEVMAAHGRSSFEAIRAINDAVGDMCKILSATFDGRTGADSYAVHGQIRRPEEAFQWWHGLYQSPPNRPNDREVVVPHSLDWPIPPSLAWRSDGEVAARWAQQGNKRALPPRPKMTTIPLDKFPRG